MSTLLSGSRDELMQRLNALGDAVKLPQWMTEDNPAFGGRCPNQVLADNDDHLLWELVFRLESGDPL